MDGSRTRPGLLGAIGQTPVVRLEHLAGSDRAEVWLKLESTNPTGSYKDRMALAMIEGAERSGRLAPGQTVVEYTGGSTGSSLAFVCALKGYPLRIVTSDAFAPEKLRTMRAFGAELEVLPSPEGITPDLIPRLMERAAEIVEEVGGYATDQFRNEDMIAGYAELGTELAEQLDGRLDAFCCYVGTAGCFLGVTRALRRTIPALHRTLVEPAESPAISEGRSGTHHIEAAASGSGRRSSRPRISTRSSPCRRPRPSQRRGVPRRWRGSSAGRRPARTSPSRSSWPSASDPARASRRRTSTRASST
jgi:cysteine synthase A